MKQYKETRKMPMDRLRNLCIKYNWYTHGNTEEYNNLLTMTKVENITTETLVEMANNIFEHSKVDYEVTTILFELSLICYSIFEEV